MVKNLSLFFLTGFLLSCAGNHPIEDYALASHALQMAKKVKANVYAKGLWYRGQMNFQRAEVYLRERNFDKAKLFFNESRKYCEKAELLSRLKRKEESVSDWWGDM